MFYGQPAKREQSNNRAKSSSLRANFTTNLYLYLIYTQPNPTQFNPKAHAPYTSLHTLSLIQLPLDVEVNVSSSTISLAYKQKISSSGYQYGFLREPKHKQLAAAAR